MVNNLENLQAEEAKSAHCIWNLSIFEELKPQL